jgi:hypothetical protein
VEVNNFCSKSIKTLIHSDNVFPRSQQYSLGIPARPPPEESVSAPFETCKDGTCQGVMGG